MTDFKAKMHQIRFRLGLRPRPRWGSLERSPDPLTGFGGPLRGRGRGWGRGGKGEGSEREVEGRETESLHVTVEPGPLRALLRHCTYPPLGNFVKIRQRLLELSRRTTQNTTTNIGRGNE